MDKPVQSDSVADSDDRFKTKLASSAMPIARLVDPQILDHYRSTLIKAWGADIESILEPLFRSEVWTGQNLVVPSQGNPSAAQSGSQNRKEPFLSIGLPSSFADSAENASRLIWAPFGLPDFSLGVSVCVASSRLTRNLDELDSWFDGLRTHAAKMVGRNQFFVTIPDTTTDRFVRRVAENFGIPYLTFVAQRVNDRAFRDDVLLKLSQRTSDAIVASEQLGYPCFLYDLQEGDGRRMEQTSHWCPDQFLMDVASEVVLLSVREGGKIDQAVRQRLLRDNSIGCCLSSVKLLISNQTKPKLRSELLSIGAVGWWLYDENSKSTSEDFTDDDATSVGLEKHRSNQSALMPSVRPRELKNEHAPILALEEFPAEQFLMHWTRRCAGPWPDQPEEEYLDDLIFKTERRRHGERSALCRILATGRIMATRRLTRDSIPVVSFSNQSLTDLHRLTVFRQHLGRWDFVPFGIAIERDWLKQRGAREVLYGDEKTWESMSDSDKPFFQVARSKTGKIDWTIEKEWRFTGDLALKEIPLNSIAVFVASQADAELIREFSRWPIVVIDVQ